ncbi:MAG: glycosyltransferase [Candidatus Marsarchaeota archaeon]|nr:glycosyltransferase [Candidatus Marsarchaeota archaeon]
MNILLICDHPPIDAVLMQSWLEMGHTVYLQFGSTPWNKLDKVPKGVRIEMPRKKPDFIYCGKGRDVLRILALKISRRWLGVPILIHHRWYPSLVGAPLYYFARNTTCCKVAQSALYKVSLLNSKVVYCPVDTNFYGLSAKRSKMVVAIGNGFKERSFMGYDKLLAIFRKIHVRDPKLKLILIGNNRQEDFPKYVKCKFVSPEGLRSYMQKASCIFFTTTKNLIMHSMLNSMSCGANVIAFDLKPLHEVITDRKTGYLVKNFDTTAFASKVIKVAYHYNASMGESARKVVVKKCENKLVAQQFLDVITKHQN